MKGWYILQTRANCEGKVAKHLKNYFAYEGAEEVFEDVLIPMEKVITIEKGGARKEVDKKLYPGYIIVHCDIAHPMMKKSLSSATGIVGLLGSPDPAPLSDVEIREMQRSVQEGATAKKVNVSFVPGDRVRIIDGAFSTFVATVLECYDDNRKILATVEILGRQSQVDLSYDQVEKV